MNLQELIEELMEIGENNPILLEQPVTCYYAEKSGSFDIDRIGSAIQNQTAETIIYIE